MWSLNQFCAFKLLLCPSCFQRGIILVGLQVRFTFTCVKGTKCRFPSTAHDAAICESQHCVDLNLCTYSELGLKPRPQRFVATKATVLFVFFFSFFFFYFRQQ